MAREVVMAANREGLYGKIADNPIYHRTLARATAA